MGAPTLLDDEKTKIICAALRKGAAMSHAAAFAGVGRRTVFKWLRRGAEGKEPYATFAAEVEKAKGVGALKLLDSLERAAFGGDTRAAMWLLERCHGYDPKSQIQLTGAGGGPVQIEHGLISTAEAETMSDAQLDQVAERLEKLERNLVIEAEALDG